VRAGRIDAGPPRDSARIPAMTETIVTAPALGFETWQPGPVLNFPGFELADGPIVSPPPARVEVQQSPVLLRHKKARGLRYAAIGKKVVLIHSHQTLAEGTDYRVDRARGLVTGAEGTEERKVQAVYEAFGERIDLVIADAAGKLRLIQGVEVPRLAQQFEPAVPPSWRKMFRIYRTARGCDIQPVHLFVGAARLDQPRAYASAIQRSRDCLAAFIEERLKPGKRLRWGAYGDSITALGGGLTDALLNACPNIRRDLDFYFWNYSAAAMASVPRYTFDQLFPEDVPALVAAGHLDARGRDEFGYRHVKVSQHWRLIEWLEATFGVEIAYRNWGVGSTNSTNGLSPKGLMHMSHPERLAAILDDGLDVVNIATGMNEMGADYTYDNLIHIGSKFKDRGVTVILCCPLRANPRHNHPVEAWRKTCDEIERAARDLDCACVQTRHLFEDDALLGWCSAEELGAASATSHPGIKEMAQAGELAIDLFR
jgi:hypothetical protein